MSVYDLYLAFNQASYFFYKVYSKLLNLILNNDFLQVVLIITIAIPFIYFVFEFFLDYGFSLEGGFKLPYFGKKHDNFKNKK